VLFLIVIISDDLRVRHMVFTVNRLVGRQRHPYIDVAIAQWPQITVFIATRKKAVG
jgi:hypothetical protein